MEPTYFESMYPETARFAEIEKIKDFVTEGNSCQVIGLPGVGRANLLRFLAYNKAIRQKHFGDNQKWVHFVMVDFSEMRSRGLFDVTKFLFLSLIDSLRERRKETEHAVINEIFRESLSFHDELVLFQGLKRAVDFLAIEQEYTIVFLFDRFEEYVPDLTAEFFANLRVLRNRAKYRFSVVMSLNRPLEDIVEPTLLTDFYEFIAGHVVYLALQDEPSNTFRLSYLEKVTGKKLEPQQLKEIIQLTGGHGRLVRICAELVLAHGVEEGQLREFLSRQKAVQRALEDIWQALSPSEQTWLLKGDSGLAEHEPVESYLSQLGLVKEDRVQLPLFEDFLHEEGSRTPQTSERIIYDVATSTITKGDTTLSDRLTGAEYRLLAYLLEHPEQIIERQQIIDVVWQEAASTAGVTDQAVDQLVFRLRKKIEDDPNKPEHLLTIKGRGFKFTP